MYYNNDMPSRRTTQGRIRGRALPVSDIYSDVYRKHLWVIESRFIVNFQLATNKIYLTIVEWQRRARSTRFFKSRNSKYSELRGLGHNKFAKNTAYLLISLLE